ncbi:hypothetical protein HNP84_002908 [Thermocatellispora tengchongensis]|uniref:Uncharacterized protein n=1 Tax=Thermocatellispora tengchongensis TaxID=1073253 RepID=A0A840P7J3_9ACTN|nr:hypothetical protein [Thermocatellispora tengchongensis]
MCALSGSLRVSCRQEEAEQIPWHEGSTRKTHVRILAHTCECEPTLYELCQAGSTFFVRRTRRGRSRSLVHETRLLEIEEAQELWEAVLSGEAH